jgi:phosphoserine aminotransferase
MANVYNFNAGPAVLPAEVLREAQEELLDYRGIGMSILEISHRSKEYEAVNEEAQVNVRELLGLTDDYHVLFLQGGASMQFSMVPQNFLSAGKTASYVLTGSWSEKALKEAQRIGETHVAASTREENYTRIPERHEIEVREDAVYVHITSNNTIFGTQWSSFPDFGDVPVVADMSSDILSRRIDTKAFALIYAGAQKNIGPAGVTLVVIRPDFLEKAQAAHLPTMLQYETHVKNRSLYNTPPVFAVYLMNLVLRWIKKNGGVEGMEKRNEEKAKILYDVIDGSGGFYRGHAVPASRSRMNVTFRLPTEELEKRFVAESEKQGLVGLKGHRSVGGLRASIYNAMTVEGCKALADFMQEFQRRHG